MNTTVEDVIHDLSGRVFTIPIHILWRSQEPLPGAGERPSQSRGSSGDEIISRQKYESGDDPHNVDHFASAQSGDDTLITITRLEPRDVRIEILVDVGLTMQFGTQMDKCMLAAQLVASILACTNKTFDPARMITFSETKLEESIGPKSGKAIFAAALNAVLQPPEVIPTETEALSFWDLLKALVGIQKKPAAKLATNNAGLCEAIDSLSKRKSLVIVISDFLNLSDAAKEKLKDAAGLHDLICVIARDERELILPEGRLCTVRDIATNEYKTVWLNAASRAAFKLKAERELAELGAFFHDANCDAAVFSTEQGVADVIPLMIQLFGGHRR